MQEFHHRAGRQTVSFPEYRIKPGIQQLLGLLRFAEKIKEPDLIITGEGKANRQTVMGKFPQASCRNPRNNESLLCMLLAGKVEDKEILVQAGFNGVFASTSPSFCRKRL
ncbi:glycerate kinase [Bacteroides sp. KG123]|uniref:glycerate kinase n=1 Tax=unclassified Bacteroides TaxID=2646097 RepID=UPI003D7F7381